MLEVTTINHRARREAELSNDEYCLVDLIDRLSNNPPKYAYCTLSKENMAKDLGITRQGLLKMIDRLCEKGYIEDAGRGKLRSTNAWFEIVNKVYIDCKQSVQSNVNKVYNESKQSLHNNSKQENLQKETQERAQIEDACSSAVNANRKALTTELPNVQAPFESEECRNLWRDWQEHLSEKRRPATRITLELHAKDLRMHNEATAIAMIRQSIQKGWTSLYPIDKKQQEADAPISKRMPVVEKPKMPKRQ